MPNIAHWAGLGRRRRHLRRYRKVVNTLARHGFLYIADAIGLGSLVSPARRLSALGEGMPDPSWPERVAAVLTDLGATFVKLGQLASTRTDWLPAPLVEALERLQDQVPPFPYETVSRMLAEAWGRDPGEVVEIDPVPLAAASIGQVHSGRLPDGAPVVVKVRRPGLVEEARTDFEILQGLADLVERRTDWGREYGIRQLVEELIRTMKDEMDFSIEARHTERARTHASVSPPVLVPHVYWEWTRPDVLMVSRVEGIKIRDAREIRRHGLDPRDVASRLVTVMYRQIFIDGFFHADPHPGNVHLKEDGTLIFLDWGMVGYLSPEMRERSIDLLIGMMRGRADMVVQALTRMGVAQGELDRPALERDVERLRRRYYENTLQNFQLGAALTDLFNVANQYRLRIPGDYALLAKSAVTLDGLVRRLDPEASLLQYGQPLLPEFLLSRFSPSHLAEETLDVATTWAHVLREAPRGLEHLIARLEKGEVDVRLEHRNLDRVLQHWEKLINRIGMSFLLSALIIGSALVAHRDSLDRLTAMPFGEYVFLAAAAMALWAIIGAIRRDRL
jgi:ubiquinone biosynthesis protein